jgi:citrate lyase beta subunit
MVGGAGRPEVERSMPEPVTTAWLDTVGADLDAMLAQADAELRERFPGPGSGRQPVHTVYVPADQVTTDLGPRWGQQAADVLDRHGERLRLEPELVARVRAKLAAEPVEDLRVDFEDGYGVRDDETEDAAVHEAVRTLAEAAEQGTAPPFVGIRFKSFEAPTRRRGVRTLGLFVAGLVESGRGLDGVVVTLPKVTSVEQVEAMVRCCDSLEQRLALPGGAIGFEIQVETPQCVLGPDGTALVARMLHAADGRCTGLHYGTYDYSASCGIAAGYQSMEHPVADHAKAVMQVAAAGTAVRLSDGSTNLLPVGDEEQVLAAWQTHQRLVRRSLERGFYQGWDMHPAQLPTRFAATFGFYRDGLTPTADRLRRYVEQTSSGVLDEPATARALADFLARGLDCGALDDGEVRAGTGLDIGGIWEMARPGR